MNGERKGQGRAPREITERVRIKGKLRLLTPTSFGSGDAEGPTDMQLLRDPVEGRPLLTGASIAGALRNYLHEFQRGYRVRVNTKAVKEKKTYAERLFGHLDDSKEDDRAAVQSWLLIEDSFGVALDGTATLTANQGSTEVNPQNAEKTFGVELRDGVAIEAKTRTAEEGKKFDVELLEAGWSFDIQLELLLNGKEADNELLSALVVALKGLQDGEIGLGYRKRRGFGRCTIEQWEVCHYHLANPKELVAWLEQDESNKKSGKDITTLMPTPSVIPDKREYFTIDATFAINGSLLIRSYYGGANAPDMVHLRSRRDNDLKPILSGTSITGAIRARASRIINTINSDKIKLIDDIFGKRIEKSDDQPTGSRVYVEETELQAKTDLVQSRVKIDRFTGGSFQTALFNEQPAFGGEDSRAQICITLQNPQDAEIGLLLLVLKDLWTGDLPLGGESSVGRGRLKGICAQMTLRRNGKTEQWKLEQKDVGIEVTGDKTHRDLEKYVEALWQTT